MDHFITIGSVVVFIENRLHGRLDYKELEKETGFSLAHIRDIFVQCTGKSLSRYIIIRKVANAAFDLVHGTANILEIAEKYGFQNPDTFTRAFKRVTGITPQMFRNRRCSVGRIKLCAGVYGVGISKANMEESRNETKN